MSVINSRVFLSILTRFVDYYISFWCPKAIFMVVESKRVLTRWSSRLAIWVDSGPFLLSFGIPKWFPRLTNPGVRCHIPSFWHCTSTSLWWCIMFTFTESWNGDCPNPSILRIHQVHLKYFQSIQVAFKNVHHLWKNAGNSNQRWCTFFHVILDLWTNIYCIWVGANICYIYF